MKKINKNFTMFLLTAIMATGAYAATTYTVPTKAGSQGKVVRQIPQVQNYTPQTYNASAQTAPFKNGGVIELLVDFSGSMDPWIAATESTLKNIAVQIPSSVNVGLRVFGQYGGASDIQKVSSGNLTSTSKNGKTVYTAKIGNVKNIMNSSIDSCSKTSQVTKIAPLNVQALLAGFSSVNIGGSTPLTLGLRRTIENDFASFPQNVKKRIIMITDGYENCAGDPCKYIKEVVAQRNDITIDVILVASGSKAIKCLTSATNGKLYTVDNPYQFPNVLEQTIIDAAQDTSDTNSGGSFNQNYQFVE